MAALVQDFRQQQTPAFGVRFAAFTGDVTIIIGSPTVDEEKLVQSMNKPANSIYRKVRPRAMSLMESCSIVTASA